MVGQSEGISEASGAARPASSTSTRRPGSADSRLASTQPADPAPTMIVSYIWFSEIVSMPLVYPCGTAGPALCLYKLVNIRRPADERAGLDRGPRASAGQFDLRGHGMAKIGVIFRFHGRTTCALRRAAPAMAGAAARNADGSRGGGREFDPAFVVSGDRQGRAEPGDGRSPVGMPGDPVAGPQHAVAGRRLRAGIFRAL